MKVSKKRQAGADAEITPEMELAGLEVLWRYDPSEDNATETLRWIFCAMQQARHQPHAEERRVDAATNQSSSITD